MTTITKPLKRTPLHATLQKQGVALVEMAGWQVASQFSSVEAEVEAAKTAVALAERSAMGKVAVQSDAAAAVVANAYGVTDLGIGDGVESDGTLIYRLRHDMFLLNMAAGGEADAVAKLEAAGGDVDALVTVTDVTNGRFQYTLVGPQAALLLGRLCGLDFHNNTFPNMQAKQSSVAKTRQTILRHDIGDLPAYSLIGVGSFGQYVWETIMEAGENLGIKPMGNEAYTQLTTA